MGAKWEFITYLSLVNYDKKYDKLKFEIKICHITVILNFSILIFLHVLTTL